MTASLLWIERLRWGTALAQVALIALVAVGSAPAWPIPPMLGLLAVGVLSNGLLAGWRQRATPPEEAIAGLLVLDTALLTVLLWITGGSSSPFSLLYLVPVIGASFALSPSKAWAVLASTGLAYGALFAFGPAPEHHHGAAEMRAHILGMFGAYAFTAPLIVVALTRVGALRSEAEARVVEALHMQARTRHLASLATLAAGAAHELATPLSTIMMVARELERHTEGPDRDDLVLIREEVLRCQDILTQLSADAGAGMGEVDDQVNIAALVDQALEGGQFDPVHLDMQGTEVQVSLPGRLVRQMLRRLLGNARDASGEQPIAVQVTVSPSEVVFTVADTGTGMRAEDVARCTDPFFTTKSEGEGTGLGLFFVQSVVQHYGGHLQLESAWGQGTTATLSMPTGREDR